MKGERSDKLGLDHVCCPQIFVHLHAHLADGGGRAMVSHGQYAVAARPGHASVGVERVEVEYASS